MHLEKSQEFWDVMDELDYNTWVLEPEKPTRCATNRRIALGEKVSMLASGSQQCKDWYHYCPPCFEHGFLRANY